MHSILRPLALLPILILAACGDDGETAGGGTPTAPDQRLVEAGPLGDVVIGNPDAPVTVIEYASMTCSHCAAFHANVQDDFIAQYVDTGRARFIFREYPLDPVALAAATLARCAPGETGYYGMIDLLFDTQAQWVNAPDRAVALSALAQTVGFTQASFEACLSNQSIIDGVTWNYDRGTELGVNATPTFFINGEKHTGELTLEQLGALVAAAE